MSLCNGRDLAEKEQRLAEVLEDYLRQLEAGNAPTVTEFLEQHADLAGALREPLSALCDLYRTSADYLSPRPVESLPLGQLGNYRLLRELGRGGMGVVYEAEDLTLRRRVALKVLPFAALLSPTQLARFQTEARAAAQLYHPHIVPVFAVGCDRGIHFYAMQYIEGSPLDRAIEELRDSKETVSIGLGSTLTFTPQAQDKRSAPPRGGPRSSTVGDPRGKKKEGTPEFQPGYFRRVAELGRDLALALQHAHDVGILHRDIKPSNILLDQFGRPWITDFGLARLPEDGSQTRTGDILGSVRYMSPEQAAGRRLFVDHRSDIYSLGITLYELLTLTPAFPCESREEFLQQIANRDPPAPRKSNPAIPSALESIILKATQKEPQQRYQSAAELADDLQRFLDGRSILAQRTRWSDASRNWLRRHRVAVSWSAALLIAIGLFGYVAAALVLRANSHTRRALQEAHASLLRAESYYQSARLAIDELGLRTADRLAHVPGTEAFRRDVLEKALQSYRSFIAQSQRDPRLYVDMSTALLKMGRIYRELEQPDESERCYNQALESLATQPATLQGTLTRARIYNNRGYLAYTLGRNEAGLRDLRQAAAIFREISRGEEEVSVARADLACALSNQSLVLSHMQRNAEAYTVLEESVAIQQELLKMHPQDRELLARLAISIKTLARLCLQTPLREGPGTASEERLARTEGLMQEAIALQAQVCAQAPDDPTYQEELAMCWADLAGVQSRHNKTSLAIESYRQAIKVQESLVAHLPHVVRYRCDLAVTLNNLGRLLLQSSQPGDSIPYFQQARAMLEELLRSQGERAEFLSSLSGAYFNLGLAWSQAQDRSQAHHAFRQALEYHKAAYQRCDGDSPQRPALEDYQRQIEQCLQAIDEISPTLDTVLGEKDA